VGRGRRRPADLTCPGVGAVGVDAPMRAVDLALQRADGARALVLVEGISDQIAIAAAARRLGRDLAAEGVVVVPAGGAGSIAALAMRFGPMGARLPLVGLCDAAEVPWLCKTLVKARVGIALDRQGLQALGFFVCDRDLEDELIRALGPSGVEALFQAEGDLDAFRTFQRQGKWKAAGLTDQIRRFLGAAARRKPRYAALVVQALPVERMPAPLVALLRRLEWSRWSAACDPVRLCARSGDPAGCPLGLATNQGKLDPLGRG